MTPHEDSLNHLLSDAYATFEEVLDHHRPRLQAEEIGRVISIGHGIARVSGLSRVQLDELVRFAGDLMGFAFNLDAEEVGVILLGESRDVESGSEVRRTGRVLDVPVGPDLLGRVVDGLGRPLDGRSPVRATQRLPIERPVPPIMARDPVTVPLQTGIKVVDALIPIGRGQRELILGDRQCCKTAIALDAIINQRDKGVVCLYCAIGQRNSAVAELIEDLKKNQALDHTIVVVAAGEDPPGLKFITPYAATSMAEYFMEQGRDVLIVYDDLTRHAWAYRELSLLLRRPPGREAFPGDIFYIHSRLLERSTHLRQDHGGGSLTALPIIETQAQNISAYIPTNLISITDGQIYVLPGLFHKGVLPSIDVGKSVSRVGGKAQLPAYRAVAGDLRLSYAQFEELESFARFDTRLDEKTRQTLDRGARIREVFKQPQQQPLAVPEQIAVLLAVTQGVVDSLPVDRIAEAGDRIGRAVRDQRPELRQRILDGDSLGEEDKNSLLDLARSVVEDLKESPKHAND